MEFSSKPTDSFEIIDSIARSRSESRCSKKLNLKLRRGSVYKLWTFSSRGTFLLLILNFFVWSGHGIPTTGIPYYLFNTKNQRSTPRTLTMVPVVLWLPAVLLFGLLADIRYGRKKIVFFGLLLMWMFALIDCARVTFFYYSPDFWHKIDSGVFDDSFSTVIASVSAIANAPFLVNSVQLAIDQLVDASAEQVSSFIQWYVFSSYFGAWIFQLLTAGPLLHCFRNAGLIEPLIRFTLAIFNTLALGLAMVCGNLIVTLPIGANPMKLVGKVLKFASKHKYPVCRSAHTYWEDKIPSRINLGKEKYGGPYTNEQVEDVKTFFRMICLTIPSAAALGSSKLVNLNFIFSVHWAEDTLMDFNYSNSSIKGDECIRSLYATTLADPNLWNCIFVLCSEFLIYPTIKYRLPSMLKRIGFAFFLTLPMSISVLILNVTALIHQPVTVDRLLICFFVSAISSLQNYLLVSSFLEFTCAQSPQSMKGFLIGFMWLMYVLLSVISYTVYLLSVKCIAPGCGTSYFSIVTIFSAIGFVIYCVLARWYRNRERDDCPNVQAVIEEVFARRLATREDTSSSV